MLNNGSRFEIDLRKVYKYEKQKKFEAAISKVVKPTFTLHLAELATEKILDEHLRYSHDLL